MLPLCFALLLFLAALAVSAQDSDSVVVEPQISEILPILEDTPPFRDSILASPYHAVMTHLHWTHEPYNQLDSASYVLFAPGLSQEDREDLARKLRLIFNGLGYVINPNELPRDPDYQDTLGRNRYIPVVDLPEIYLERVGKQWRYSRHSVTEIPKLYRSISPFGILEAVDDLPEWFHSRILGIRIWKYVLVIILILMAIGVRKLLVPLLRILLQKIVNKLNTRNIHLDKEPFLGVVRPISLLVTLMVIRLFVPAFQMSVQWNEYIMWAFRAIIPIMGVVAVYRIVDLIGYLGQQIASRTENPHDDQLVPILRTVGHIVVILTGTLYVLDRLDFNVTALLAGLSIGGLALALAAQDTVKNFFGSIMIFLDRPFRVGDYIATNGVEGTVEVIGLRATRLRTPRNSLVYVPNAMVTESTVDNLGLRVFRRYDTQLGLQYNTPPPLLKVFVGGVRALAENHPKTRKDNYQVSFFQFADSSLNIFLLVFFEVTTYAEELEAREELNFGILRLANILGVSFAFPTQTVHIESVPGHISNSTAMHSEETAAEAIETVLAETKAKWEARWHVPEEIDHNA